MDCHAMALLEPQVAQPPRDTQMFGDIGGADAFQRVVPNERHSLFRQMRRRRDVSGGFAFHDGLCVGTEGADVAGIAEAAEALRRGGLAVMPTDTVYGLAAHPSHHAAVERLYAIKGRDARKPIALLAADADAIAASLQ